MGLFNKIDHLFAHGKGIKYWASHPFGDAHNAKQAFSNMTDTISSYNKDELKMMAGVMTGGISTEAGLVSEFIKDRVSDYARRKSSTGLKRVSNAAKSFKRDFQHYSKKVQDNSAMSGGNRRMAQIPASAKREYESRYFEVYRDSKTGETYLWGKPTLGPNSFRKDPAGFAREWGENVRRLDPKYKKSDPLYRDMAKIKAKYGRIDHISGYSRGGHAAQYQSAKDSKSSRIFGPFVPYGGIGDHRARRRRKFDPIHVGARGITKYYSKVRTPLKFLKYARRL